MGWQPQHQRFHIKETPIRPPAALVWKERGCCRKWTGRPWAAEPRPCAGWGISNMGVSIVMGVPQNGWFLLGKIPSRNGIHGWFVGTPILGNPHMTQMFTKFCPFIPLFELGMTLPFSISELLDRFVWKLPSYSSRFATTTTPWLYERLLAGSRKGNCAGQGGLFEVEEYGSWGLRTRVCLAS